MAPPLAERLRMDRLLTDSQPSTLNSQPLRGSHWAQSQAAMLRVRNPLAQERQLAPYHLTIVPTNSIRLSH